MTTPIKKTIGIISSARFNGQPESGSSMIRVRWPLQVWPEAEPFALGRDYEAVIFQKAYWLADAQKLNCLKIFDLCDPNFIFMKRVLEEMLDCCDAITVSTPELAGEIGYLTKRPVFCVPDRLWFPEFGGLKKNHKGSGRAKTAGWFGYPENFPMLNSMTGGLAGCGIKQLVVISKEPYYFPFSGANKVEIINIPYKRQTVYGSLARCDVVLNPRSLESPWNYKSNNKTLVAWALGLPVAHNLQELTKFMAEPERIAEGEFRYHFVRREYDVKKSVEDYRNIIKNLAKNNLTYPPLC